jgi:hypothetical protein
MILNPLNGVYGSLIKFGLVVTLLAGLYGGYKYQLHSAYKEGVTVTQTQHEAERLAANEVLHLKKLAADKDLQRELEKQRIKYNEQLATINANANSLINSLSDRASRPEPSSSSADTVATESSRGAYPSQLFREDAAAFINLARDAEEVRLALLQCYKDYDTVKQAVESFNQK